MDCARWEKLKLINFLNVDGYFEFRMETVWEKKNRTIQNEMQCCIWQNPLTCSSMHNNCESR